MATSLLKTLAGKNQTSVMKEAKRLQGTLQTPEGPRTCLKLTIPREGKRPLVATFGGLSLKRVKHPVIKLTFRTLFRSSEAILTEPPEERGGRAMTRAFQSTSLFDFPFSSS